MSTRNKLRRLTACLLCVGVVAAGRLAAAPPLPPQPGDVLIENSGSTNTAGCSISVSPSGHVRYRLLRGPASAGTRFATAELGHGQVRALFRDLHAALPLMSLPVGRGMRSASFGTRTFVTYGGRRSPDLSFPGGPRSAALASDVAAIMQALHLVGVPRRSVPLSVVLPASH